MSLISQLRALTAPSAPWPTTGMPSDRVVLFAPRDKVAMAIQQVLNSAKVSLKVAMFTLTDPTVNALLHAKAALPAPFEFQMTLDSVQATTNAAMVPIVAGWGTDERVVVGNSGRGNYSHSKIAVVDHLYVMSGSTNYSVAGQGYEDNELIVQKHVGLAAWYEKQLDAVFARMVAKRAAGEMPLLPMPDSSEEIES
jgi:phosphatidylserine/phosphatidylglycerophosphate/cardiolipin synthase-like enzyme